MIVGTLSADSASQPPIKISYRPKPGLGAIMVQNFFLNLITLYIYNFWGKTNVRKHIWSCVTVMDEPLEYTGTGKELALGFLVVLFLVLLPLFGLQLLVELLGPDSPISVAITVLIPFGIIYLVGVGMYRARRYRLSRTLWRGIRGTLSGSSWNYGLRYLGMTFTLGLTLFWTYPWMNVALNSKITNDTVIGNRPFSFIGGSGPLYGRFAVWWFGTLVACVPLFMLGVMGLSIWLSTEMPELFSPEEAQKLKDLTETGFFGGALLVMLPIVGIIFLLLSAFYSAGELNYMAKCTGFDRVEFKMNASTRSLIGLIVGNLLIQLLTLGIAAPFVQQRLVRYLCDRLTAHGNLDLEAIRQSQAELDRTGEGLAEAFDIDAF